MNPQTTVPPHGPCPNCGNTTAPHAVICTDCGYNFARQQKTTIETPDQLLPPHPSNQTPSFIARRFPHHFDPLDHRFVDLDFPLLLFPVAFVLLAFQSNNFAHFADLLLIRGAMLTPLTVIALLAVFKITGGLNEPGGHLLLKTIAIAFAAGVIVNALVATLLTAPFFTELGVGAMPAYITLTLFFAAVIYLPLLLKLLDLETTELIFAFLALLVVRNLCVALLDSAGFTIIAH